MSDVSSIFPALVPFLSSSLTPALAENALSDPFGRLLCRKNAESMLTAIRGKGY
jgi:hypothetical protein